MGWWESLFLGINKGHLESQDEKLKKIEDKLDSITSSSPARHSSSPPASGSTLRCPPRHAVSGGTASDAAVRQMWKETYANNARLAQERGDTARASLYRMFSGRVAADHSASVGQINQECMEQIAAMTQAPDEASPTDRAAPSEHGNQARSKTRSRAKFCTQCGHRLKRDHKFCGECGAPATG